MLALLATVEKIKYYGQIVRLIQRYVVGSWSAVGRVSSSATPGNYKLLYLNFALGFCHALRTIAVGGWMETIGSPTRQPRAFKADF